MVLPDKIDIGCGPVHKLGFLRVDHDASMDPDVCFELETTPWPLPSNYFNEVNCTHVIEHLTDSKVLLNEIIRIARDGCVFNIEFPHFSNSFIEPDHRRGYGLHALALFPEFRVERVRLEWSPHRKGKSHLFYLMNWLINKLANVNPYVTERVFCYWVGGFSNVVLIGRIKKNGS